MTEKVEKKISKKTLARIKEKVDLLIDNGSSIDHAISVVSNVNGFNPKTIKTLLVKEYDYNENNEDKDYKDIKNDEGSYVMLKKNPGKDYEVINIINKDNIILSDLDNDSELRVKEEDIIPIVTETKMKELNEAQYTVSIDNLETTDAETLSQMLSLAGQAEQPTEMGAPVEPEMGMDTFEPSIPSTMDGPGFEAAEIDNFENPVGEEIPADDMPVVDAEEDVVLPAEESEIVGESLEEGCVKEDVLVPAEQKDEKSDATTAEDSEETIQEKCAKIFKDVKEEVGGDETAVSDMINELHDMGNLSEEEYDYLTNHFDELYTEEEGISYPEDIEDLKRDVEWEKKMDAKDAESEKEYDEPKKVKECGTTPVEESTDFDAEIAEALRNAGIQLDEVSEEIAFAGKKDLPTPPIGKANPAKTADVPEGQAPDYKEVSTEDAMGYDATEGFTTPCNIKVCETVNKKKIESILETASHMYAKKESSEWLALDRRYTDKLLREGVSYSNASRMLMKAKAGK